MRPRHSRPSVAPAARLLAKLAMVLAVLVATAVVDPRTSRAAVPSGFTDSVVTNVGAPTDIDFLPDGKMLVASQGGGIYLRVGANLTQIGNLADRLCSNSERGLLGITPDPGFAANRYVYVFYTYDGGRSDCLRNSPLSPWNRVSRFTLRGDNSVDTGSELVLVDKMPSPAGNHNAGTVAVGPDGYLYIAIGDGGCDLQSAGACGGANTNARKRNILTGKILRVSRSNGAAPSSNPFYASGGTCRVNGRTSAANCRETYAWGFRNPFKFSFDPVDGRLNINDVGQGTTEEIDRGLPGEDYGWNACEGRHDRGTTTGTCGTTQRPPIAEYFHGGCNSITGGDFIPESGWPSAYDGRWFFADYTCGRIWSLDGGGTIREFASGLGAVTELAFGPYGSKVALYYADYGSGDIHRVVFTDDDNRAPTADASADPTFGPLNLRVQFDARGSADPDGDDLRYRWDFGDGASSTSERPVHTYTRAGTYEAELTVTDGQGGSDTDTVRILAGAVRPTAEILTPTSGTRFTVGQRITLKGRGTDSSGDAISSRNFTWEVLLHHDSHTHPLIQPTSGNSIVFTAPAPEDLAAAATSYVEIRLTVRDENGLGTRVTRRLDPLKVTTTFASNVPGLDLQVEGVNVEAPFDVETWAGDRLSVIAPDQVGEDGTPYVYAGWSDGGRRSHEVVVATADSTVTASFAALDAEDATILGDARVRESSPDSNEGSATRLTARGRTTSDYETLLRFRVAGTGGDVDRAILYLYATDGSVDGPAIYRTSPSWSEAGVTWNNRPGPSGGQLDNAGPIFARSWVAYDVTATITGDGTYSLLLRDTSTDAVSWYSREGGANQPRLVVVSDGVGGGGVEDPSSVASPLATPGATATPDVTATPTTTPTPEATLVPTATPTTTPTPEATLVPTETATPAVEPTAAPVATLPVADGFETGLTGWVAEGATLAPTAGPDGSTAARLTATGSADAGGSPAYLYRWVDPNATELYVSAELAIIAQDAQPARLLTVYGPEGVEIASVFATGDGNVGVTYAATGQTEFVASVALSTWLAVELHVALAGDGTAVVDVWVDGALARTDVVATGATSVDAVQVGHRATDRSFDVLVDDVAIDQGCTRSCPPAAEPGPEPEPAASPVAVVRG